MGFLGFLEVVITSNLGGPVGGLVGWVRFQEVITFKTKLGHLLMHEAMPHETPPHLHPLTFFKIKAMGTICSCMVFQASHHTQPTES